MSSNKLQQLKELAAEPSSERRRELLREITDLFFEGEETHNPKEMDLFDDVMGQISKEMEVAVRAELAERMADATQAPARLARSLATDSIAVARPMLMRSRTLSDEDQLEIARTQGEAHLRALSTRPNVRSDVTDEIVKRADDETIGVLLRNESAQLSRESHERIVDRAQDNPDLHEAVIDRHELPVDLLNEMYFAVETKLREKILEKNSQVDPKELEAALAAGRKQIASRDGALPPDYDEAEAAVKALRRRGQITPQALAGMLRARQMTQFLVALADLADVDFHTARRILERKDLDALAIICKAADFERALFLTFAILILDVEDNAMARAREYGDLFTELPKEAALRTLRFWRMRRQVNVAAA